MILIHRLHSTMYNVLCKWYKQYHICNTNVWQSGKKVISTKPLACKIQGSPIKFDKPQAQWPCEKLPSQPYFLMFGPMDFDLGLQIFKSHEPKWHTPYKVTSLVEWPVNSSLSLMQYLKPHVSMTFMWTPWKFFQYSSQLRNYM